MRKVPIAYHAVIPAIAALVGSWPAISDAASGDVAAGRALAVEACTGCHVVAPDQPFPPVYTGPPPPADFHAIANRPDTSAKSLRRFLTRLPAVPPVRQPPQMANPDLTSGQLDDVIAFIMSLRDRP